MQKYKDALLACPSDLQIGSTVGLAPRIWNLIDGGTFTPSKAQKVIRKYFEQSVMAIKETRKNKRLILLLVGEPIDGVHHGTAQLISQIPEEQQMMATTMIDEMLQELGFDKKKGDQLFFIEGTEAHEGKQYSNIERVARDFDEIATFYRNDENGRDGRVVHPYKKLIINGKKYRFQHHGAGVGGRSHTRTNSLYHYISSLYNNYLTMGEEPPDWFIQGHQHRYVRATYHGIWNGQKKKIEGVILPCFQVATSFVKKIAPADLSDLGIYFQEIDSSGNVREHDETIYRAPEDEYERV